VKVLRLHAAGDLRLHDEPEPEPAPGEVLLRVEAVGLCGSDRHWVCEGEIGDAKLARPLVLGHELAGTIETGPRAGERVAVDPAIPCESCPTCAAGLGHLCPLVRFAGHSRDGGLCERMAWPERLLHSIPASVRRADAPLLEPLGVALHALDLGQVTAGTRAAVVGCGPIGLLLVQALVAAGASEIVASDPLPHRLEAALARGARAGGAHVDVAFDAAGDDDAVAAAIESVRPGGRVVLVGIPEGDRTTFPAAAARRKELTLLLARRMTGADLPRAIELVEANRVDLSGLVTERHPLSEASAAFDALVDRRGLKVVVEP
jgi:L-iditol 2-dehydrogenase